MSLAHAPPGAGGAARRLDARPWRAAQGALLAALGAAMLMWTAVANGRPPVFTDTALYYAQAEYLFEALGWVRIADAVDPPGDPTALPSTPGAPNISASIDRARSPVYGAPVYLLQRLAGLWLAASVQAFVVAGTVYLLYRAAAPAGARWGYLLLMAGLAILSPLAFFASWIMPDVFAGVMGCGLLLLLVYPDRLDAGRRAAAAALLTYALAVHRSNLLDAAVVTGIAALLLRAGGLRWREIARRTARVALAAAAAVALGAAVELPIQARAGQPIGSPPFLSARVLADGPGRIYLARVCRGPETPFELCRFANRPMASSDQVLWSVRRPTAVFLAAGPAGRLRMEREDARFALATLLAEPWAEGAIAVANAARQLVETGLDGPLRPQTFYVADGYWRQTALPKILPGAARCLRRCAPAVGPAVGDVLGDIGLALTLAFLLWRLGTADVASRLGRRRGGAGREADDICRLLTAIGLVAALLLVNAAVCGALSGPFPRYQARLIWLAPLMAGLVLAAAGPRRPTTHKPVASNG